MWERKGGGFSSERQMWYFNIQLATGYESAGLKAHPSPPTPLRTASLITTTTIRVFIGPSAPPMPPLISLFVLRGWKHKELEERLMLHTKDVKV